MGETDLEAPFRFIRFYSVFSVTLCPIGVRLQELKTDKQPQIGSRTMARLLVLNGLRRRPSCLASAGVMPRQGAGRCRAALG
jgi:hypothetical protein